MCNFWFVLKWFHWHGLTILSITSHGIAVKLQHKSNFAGHFLAAYTKTFVHVLDFALVGKISRLSAVQQGVVVVHVTEMAARQCDVSVADFSGICHQASLD